ncbi:unnamed protein product [Cuscuta epithymum]|uniref:Uncharacterized protein n=1 Tax=Cuscuta epithymum TaxID=186058 RepID=A0AAV0E3P5_9ASTE|nr:unnamed protein product [Cuscuta epithymum]CAH9147041.1 unnamed protein product [Cuscuta epithymum]
MSKTGLEEIPSFSIGLTQEATNNLNVDVGQPSVQTNKVQEDTPRGVQEYTPERVVQVPLGDLNEVALRRQGKATAYMKSPFMCRVVDPTKTYNGLEKLFGNWVSKKKGVDM